jgi:VanZ family protein
MLQVKSKYKFILLFFYFSFISILFFLPGSAFPKEDWFSKIHFDKWVHTGIFMILSFICGWAFLLRQKRDFIVLLLLTIGYGLLVEIIQGNLIANRSYDLADLLADTIGSVAGIIMWARWYIKK